MASKQQKKSALKTVPENKRGMAKQMNKKSSINIRLALLLGCLSLVVYANTLKNGFALDDYPAIIENTIVKNGIPAIPEILTSSYHAGYVTGANDLYRPLSLVLFAVEFQLFGTNPVVYHFLNVALFAWCVIFLFFFLDSLFEQKRTVAAFIASFLFALHPLHTEVVASIKSLDELLCFFFVFLGLNTFMKYCQSGKMRQLFLGCLYFFLSLLSKETAITFVAVIPLIFFFYRNDNKKISTYITGGTLLVTAIYLIARFSILSHNQTNAGTSISFMDNALAKSDIPFSSRVATAVLILGYYIKLLIVPYPLVCDYSYNSIPFVSFGNAGVLVSLCFYILVSVLGIRLFLKNRKDPIAFGILFFLITISLFTNIFFLIGTTMGERLMFFPSVGFCLVAGLLIEKMAGRATNTAPEILKSPKVLGILIPVGLFYSFIAIGRNADWANNYTLYSADIKKVPNDARLNYYLGSEIEKNVVPETKDSLARNQLQEEAISYLSRSVTIFPDFKDAQSDLGATYFQRSQYDSAAVHMKRALILDPGNITAINNLATVYLFSKRNRESIELFKKALALAPTSNNAVNWYYNAGCGYMNLQQPDSAIYYLAKTAALNPGYTDVNMQLGVCYFQTKRYDLAVQFFRKAYELKPQDINALRNLALTFKIMGNMDEARKYESLVQKSIPGFRI